MVVVIYLSQLLNLISTALYMLDISKCHKAVKVWNDFSLLVIERGGRYMCQVVQQDAFLPQPPAQGHVF